MAGLSLRNLSEDFTHATTRNQTKLSLICCVYKVTAKEHGRGPTFLVASVVLPVYLVVNTEEHATGRGRPYTGTQ